MIIKNRNEYLGLDQLDVFLLDTTPNSSEYFRLDSIPYELTAGKNLIKIAGNNTKFLPGSPILIEVIDRNGNCIFVDRPDYYDTLKRRVIVINIDHDTPAGPCLITIASVLQDKYVPAEYRGKLNFKWQTTLTVAPFNSNNTEIIYATPPKIELSTLVKPFISASFRNNIEMITRQYGDYEFYDYNFEDNVGANDKSDNIYQSNKSATLLNAYTNPSITSFDRDTIFHLREENYSARHIVKNYSILRPGANFYSRLGENLIIDSGMESITDTTSSAYWFVCSSISPTNPATLVNNWATSTAMNVGKYIQVADATATASLCVLLPTLSANSKYLISADVIMKTGPGNLNFYLGYDSRFSGSNNANSTASILVPATASFWQRISRVLTADTTGNFLWIQLANPNAAASLHNVTIYPIETIGSYDFTLNSDLIGGYTKVDKPLITPATSSDYINIDIEASSSYKSYIDQIFQNLDAGVDDRFYYELIKKSELENSGDSYNLIKHKINRFDSQLQSGYQVILNDPIPIYSVENTLGLYPNVFSPTNQMVYNNEIYGVFYSGGLYKGAIYKYNVENKTVSILHYFTSVEGQNPSCTLLYNLENNSPVLYGTAPGGGTYGSGSLYKYSLSNGRFEVLYNFGSSGSSFGLANRTHGVRPIGGVIKASNGKLYGTTSDGGKSAYPHGVLYSYDIPSKTYSYLAEITGSYSNVELIEYSGSLWGVNEFAGTNGSGSIYKYNLSTNIFTEVASFSGSDGKFPAKKLTLGSDNKFYATTLSSSVAGTGSVLYTFDPATSIITPLVHFKQSDSGSYGSNELYEYSGKFYGTLRLGGLNASGSVFIYNSSSNSVSILHTFTASLAPNIDGGSPAGNFVRVGNALYSTTTSGYGGPNQGTFFRIDLLGPSAPYVATAPGFVYHHNSILPSRIPATASLVQDFPRWTGPIRGLGTNDSVTLVELKMRDLTPLSGDVSKIKIGAKPKSNKGEYIDLGVYQTKPNDILLDTNYVNHVQYVNSPYRLSGYFKPIVIDTQTAITEDSTNEDTLFLSGWNSGSISNSYFGISNFHNNLSIIGLDSANKPIGSIVRCKVTSSLAGNGMAYMIFTSSMVPVQSTELSSWQQISYELFSAYPIMSGMDITSSNYYTGSSVLDNVGINNLLVYSALFRKTASISVSDIYSISPSIDYHAYNITGSSVTNYDGDHPYIFHNKLGWKTDDYLIPGEVAVSGSMWMGLIFEYNSSSANTFGTSITANTPHLLDVANVVSREIGDRDYIKNTYWEWYSRAKYPGTELLCSASVESNYDVLMDSVKITAIDDPFLGYTNKNKIVFQTKDSYEFTAGTKYIVSFKAISKLNELNTGIASEILDYSFQKNLTATGSFDTWAAAPFSSWASSSGNWVRFKFDTQTSGSLIPPVETNVISANPSSVIISGSVALYGPNMYQFGIKTGMFTYSTLNNPTSLTVEFPTGSIHTIQNVQPYSSYSLNVRIFDTVNTQPKFTISNTITGSSYTANILEISMKSYDVSALIYGQTSDLLDDYLFTDPTSLMVSRSNQLQSSSFWDLESLFGSGSMYVNSGSTDNRITIIENDNAGTFDQNYFRLSSHTSKSNPYGYYLVQYTLETGDWNLSDYSPGQTFLGIYASPLNGANISYGHVAGYLNSGFGTAPHETLASNTTYTGRTYMYGTPNYGGLLLNRYYDLVNGRTSYINQFRIQVTPINLSSATSPAYLFPPSASLSVYGVNTSYGVPFKDAAASTELGEFIGELVHMSEYGINGETKNFGRVEMEVRAMADGYGKLAFEIDAGTEWYISEVSVKPFDRVGLTPNYSKIFIRVPTDLINIPLTFKVEYLNDYNVKSAYTTILNDITFTNTDGQISDNNNSLVINNTGSLNNS